MVIQACSLCDHPSDRTLYAGHLSACKYALLQVLKGLRLLANASRGTDSRAFLLTWRLRGLPQALRASRGLCTGCKAFPSPCRLLMNSYAPFSSRVTSSRKPSSTSVSVMYFCYRLTEFCCQIFVCLSLCTWLCDYHPSPTEREPQTRGRPLCSRSYARDGT